MKRVFRYVHQVILHVADAMCTALLVASGAVLALIIETQVSDETPPAWAETYYWLVFALIVAISLFQAYVRLDMVPPGAITVPVEDADITPPLDHGSRHVDRPRSRSVGTLVVAGLVGALAYRGATRRG